MPEIVNVVASGHLGRELDIQAVGEDIDAEEVESSSGEYRTPTAYISFGVRNVVVVGDLEREVDLTRLALELGFE